MRRRYSAFTIILLVLIGIGILTRLLTRPEAFLLPVVVLGIIFLLYKFPPHRWKSMNLSTSAKPKHYGYKQDSKAKRKNKFKVIQGNKKDEDVDDETPPPYH
jgi:hypothetical protein